MIISTNEFKLLLTVVTFILFEKLVHQLQRFVSLHMKCLDLCLGSCNGFQPLRAVINGFGVIKETCQQMGRSDFKLLGRFLSLKES